jgi:hypothetical protein
MAADKQWARLVYISTRLQLLLLLLSLLSPPIDRAARAELGALN